MTAQRKISERSEGYYETKEVPFGRSYEWHPASITLECGCGEKVTVTATSSTTNNCGQCGADYSALVKHIRERDEQSMNETSHPWLDDTYERAAQHLRDEADYPEDSPWRYNDVTADDADEE
ncbi:MAG TPA: hypothetical protein VE288_12145 [Rubrobacteraceae bacterium]|jgi:hypothetical protein|nr:hypothetical protein [Rubrobacteraceae bacterium]